MLVRLLAVNYSLAVFIMILLLFFSSNDAMYMYFHKTLVTSNTCQNAPDSEVLGEKSGSPDFPDVCSSCAYSPSGFAGVAETGRNCEIKA